MKKNYLFVAFIAIILLLSACGKKDDKDTSLSSIKEKGKIVLGTSADYPPYEWHMISGKEDIITGVDIEIAKAVAEDLGVELEIRDMQFNGLFPSLNAGDIDMIIAGMVADEERMKAADFTEPYFEQGQVLLIRKADKDKYKDIKDLSGKKIGTQLGSTQQEFATEHFNGKIIAIPNNNDLIMELKNKSLDAVFMPELAAKQFDNLNSEIIISDINNIENEGGSSIAVKKGNTELLNSLNESVKKMKQSDTINKWFIDYSNKIN